MPPRAFWQLELSIKFLPLPAIDVDDGGGNDGQSGHRFSRMVNKIRIVLGVFRQRKGQPSPQRAGGVRSSGPFVGVENRSKCVGSGEALRSSIIVKLVTFSHTHCAGVWSGRGNTAGWMGYAEKGATLNQFCSIGEMI